MGLNHKKKSAKIPRKIMMKVLKILLIIKNRDNFEKYKIFDYRINNQLILKYIMQIKIQMSLC